MKQLDPARRTPPPRGAGRAAIGLAAAIIVASALLLTQVAAPAPSPSTQVDPTPEPTAETFTAPSLTPSPSLDVSLASSATASLPPSPSPVPSLVVADDHVATRVRIPELHIDLAVVAPPRDRNAYPKCGVAMYLASLHQPGQRGATYLYAHARAGMFLPIYERAIKGLHGGPKSMLGLAVEVYTSDDLRYVYRIDQVRVHQTSLRDAARSKSDQLWLQTSEGPRGTRGKTQVRAVPVTVTAATHRQAHPTAKPVTCG